MRALWVLILTSLIGPPATHVVVNIPAFRLDVLVGDSIVRSLPIAVGMRGFDTPRGVYEISSIEWNPWWNPPDRPWAAKQRRTPPGPTNPMGRVKLNFRPLYYLHGTPLEQSIGSAASHGCIRLRNDDALALAALIQRVGSPSMPDSELASLAADAHHSRTIELERPVPIELRYDRVEIRGAVVMVYRDIYGIATHSLRAELLTALVAHGVDTTMLDTARVRGFVSTVSAKGNSQPLDSLMHQRSRRGSQ
jgi:murein L,D-transpeptidase YcbB/YkuD